MEQAWVQYKDHLVGGFRTCEEENSAKDAFIRGFQRNALVPPIVTAAQAETFAAASGRAPLQNQDPPATPPTIDAVTIGMGAREIDEMVCALWLDDTGGVIPLPGSDLQEVKLFDVPIKAAGYIPLPDEVPQHTCNLVTTLVMLRLSGFEGSYAMKWFEDALHGAGQPGKDILDMVLKGCADRKMKLGRREHHRGG